MSKLSLDHTVTHCLCIHPDDLLVPSLTAILETNGIAVTAVDQLPSDQNWSENISYLVWSVNTSISLSEIEVIVKESVAKNSKLLCLMPLDRWYESSEILKKEYTKLTDIIEKINKTTNGMGDVRVIAYAGLWDHQKTDGKSAIGHLVNKLKQGTVSVSDTQTIYPLEASKAVQSIFSRWFDRGHRGKNILLSGQGLTGKDLKNNIDISSLKDSQVTSYWGREEQLSFAETIEIQSDNSIFFEYLKQNTVISKPPEQAAIPKVEILPPPPPVILETQAARLEPLVANLDSRVLPLPPREVRKIDLSLLARRSLGGGQVSSPDLESPTPPVPRPQKKRKNIRFGKKPLILALTATILIVFINLPNLYLLAQICLARTLTLNSKETATPIRYQQLNDAADMVASTTRELPLVGRVGESLTMWANREQNRLLTIKVQTTLVRVAKNMMSASPGNPFETLQEAKHSLDELYIRQSIQNGDTEEHKWVSQARKVVELLPQLIPSDKKINVLLLLQNNLELRPTGGFIGAVAILSFDHGKLLTIDTRDIYDLDSNLKGLVNPPDELKTYLGESSWYFRDSNWSPSFIESASTANWFLEKEWGSPAEVVIGLNLNTLKTLLEATGPLTLPNGTIVESNNLLATAFNHQDVPVAKPDLGKQEFLSQLIKPLIDNFIQMEPNTSVNFLSALGKSANEGELTIVSNNPTVLSELTDAGWSGSLSATSCLPTHPTPCFTDALAINEANVGINKANFYLTRTLNHTIKLSNNTAEHTHRITFTNNSPNATWPGGSYKTYIRTILPKETSGFTVSSDEQPINITPQTSTPGFFLEVKPQASRTVIMNYAVALPESIGSYEFQLTKQSGTTNDPLTVSIIPPPSRSLQPLTPHLFKDASLQYVGTLSKNFSAGFAFTP